MDGRTKGKSARAPWELLARELAYDLMPCMYTARRVGRPRKHEFTDDDAITFYELGTAEFEKWMDKKCPTVNARARIVAKRLGEENPVKLKTNSIPSGSALRPSGAR